MSKSKSKRPKPIVRRTSQEVNETRVSGAASRRRFSRITKVAIVAGLAAIAWLLTGLVLDSIAENAFHRRNLSKAIRWSQAARWVCPWKSDLRLVRARAARFAGDLEFWTALMQPFANRPNNPAVIREFQLGQVQQGNFPEPFQPLMVQLLEEGVPSSEVAETFALGVAVRRDQYNIRSILDAWKRDEPSNPQVEYVEALTAGFLGDRRDAITRLTKFSEAHPDHQPARLRRIDSLLAQQQFDEALSQLRVIISQGDDSFSTLLKFAHCHRQLGAVKQAKELLAPAVDSHFTRADERELPQFQNALIELGHCELELGEYAEAAKHFRAAGLEKLPPSEQSDLAIADYMSGDVDSANNIYDSTNRNRQIAARRVDLEAYLQLNPDDEVVRKELSALKAEAEKIKAP